MLKKIWIAGLSTLFSMNVYALDSFYTEVLPIVWSPIITVSAGPAWAAPGQDQYLYPPNTTPYPVLIDHFQYNSNMGVLASGEIFFGLQHLIRPWLIGELGIGLAGASDAKAIGVIDVNGAPSANSFAYKVDHGRVELKGKLIDNCYALAQPYISGGFGAGFNNSHAYVPDTVNALLYPPNWFPSNTNIAFSYTLGLGVQTKLNSHWQVGIGYEFADWGKNFLEADPIALPTLFYGPGLTHLYTHELLFSLSYLF